MDASNTPPQLSPLKQALLAIEQMRAKVEALEHARSEPIAIVGMACHFPGAPSLASFWQLLKEGRDAVTEIPSSRWDAAKLYDPDPDAPGRISTRWGGFVDNIDLFDPAFFGISPREAQSMDPQQRMLLEVAWEALESGGHTPDRMARGATGVFVGVTGDEWSQLFLKQGHAAKLDIHFAAGIARSVAGGRISYFLGIQGPNLAIDTACSSSLTAVHAACVNLRAGECRMAIAGGSNAVLSPEITMAFSKAHMMAADGRCKTFDAKADGFVRGEGCGLVVLKRLSDAVADGDRIWAVIRGSAVNQDGRSSGLTVPNGPAQEAVIKQALERAGVQGREIGYVEAHGTGTSLGDPIEGHSLAAVLGVGRPAEDPLVVGSVKTNLGHLESASGVAGLIKVVLSMQHEWIPQHLHFETLNPHIDWKGVPVEIPVKGKEWKRGARRRLAGISSFGFSGTNAHVVLEEGEPEGTKKPAEGPRVVVLSARTETALKALSGSWADHLKLHAETQLGDVSRTANLGRAHFAQRGAVVANSVEQLREKLEALSRGETKAGVQRRTKVAFLFSGQGSQYAGMGRELYEREEVFRKALDECGRLLKGELDLALTDLLWGSASELLGETAYTQPALFALEWAQVEQWRSWGVEPAILLGHSVGEYVAACVAGSCTLEEGIRLIAARGRKMGQMPKGEGAMAAILGPAEGVWKEVEKRRTKVSVAAVNGPESLVVAGYHAAVEEVAAETGRQGYRVERLKVSHGFHSPQMDGMVEWFGREAGKIAWKRPWRTVVSSVSGEVLGTEWGGSYWGRQVREPVAFQRAMETVSAQGANVMVEIGPGTTLLGMGRQTVKTEGVVWAPSMKRGYVDSEQIMESLGALYVAGVPIDWTGYEKQRGGRVISLPTYPFERQRYWIEDAAPTIHAKTAKAGSHPLLGEHVELAGGPVTHLWQTELDLASVPWIADHKVQGGAMLPMTAYLEMATAALEERNHESGVCLRDVVLQRPLVIAEDQRVLVQTVLKDDLVEIYSKDEGGWILHVSAHCAASDGTTHNLELASIQERLKSKLDVLEFYSGLAGCGHRFGPTFRRIRELSGSDGEWLAEIDGLQEPGYRLHPALLDACVQPLAGAAGGNESYLPLGITRFSAFRASGPLWAYVQTRSSGTSAGRVLWANIFVWDQDGGPVAAMEDLQLRPAGAASESVDCFSRIEWQLAQHVPAVLKDLSSQIQQHAPAISQEFGLARYDQLSEPLTLRCAHAFADALDDMKCGIRAGSQIDSEKIAAACGVDPARRELFLRLFALAEETGMMRPAASGYQVIARRPTIEPPTWSKLLADFPEFAAEIQITQRCAEGLGAVLQGRQDPLQLLFPEGSKETAERLYADSPSANVFNRLLARAVKTVADKMRERGTVRVLEIGAGTGGSTTHVLPQLPRGETEYTYTDLSRSFFARAREKFAEFPFVRYATLDLEKDPATQGFGAGEYDIIIAANVIHATADLRETLRYVRKLLAPQGVLMLLEVTQPEWWIDLTFGMTDGWWRFRDRDLRPSYPLLAADQWSALLAEEGFAPPQAIAVGHPSLNTIFIAPARPLARVDGEFLAITGAGPHSLGMVEQLAAAGVHIKAVAADGAIEKSIGSQPWAGILHLASLDSSAGGLETVQRANCGSLLEVVRVASRLPGPLPRVSIITSGAQQISKGDAASVAQAPVWGVARTIAYEHPGLFPVAIDIDPSMTNSAEAIVRELSEPDGESQIAWRAGERFVARLKRVPLKTEESRSERLRLKVTERGMLENIQMERAARRQPQPGQVEIEVDVASLGFRDVLNVMGMYPGDPGPLGAECAGRVASVGSGVKDFRPGDRVAAIAPGALDGYVVVNEALVAHVPDALMAEDAATVATSMVTARIALNRLADLRAGQTVLIHAASGGVGFCAIQVARQAGAIIFTTAGNEEKRQYLRSLGLDHVLDSRTTDFAAYVKLHTAGRGVDVVLNSAIGEIREASFAAIASGGTFLEIGKNGIWSEEQVQALGKGIRYHVIDWSPETIENPTAIGTILRQAMLDLNSGTIQPMPRTVFPFSDAVEAFRYMARARHIGRVALRQLVETPMVRPEGTYLITGGTRGLGLLTAKWLAGAGAKNLVLIGRSAPTRESLDELAALEQSGTRVLALRADVSQEQELAEALAVMRSQMPPLRGIFHAAGVLDDGLLATQSWEQFHRVLAPKVEGAWNLHHLTAADPLDHFVLFSSVASVLGAPGQGNHAAANCFEDALAHWRRERGLPAVSINWGSWSETGSAIRADLAEQRRALGIQDFSPQEGVEILERILSASPVQITAAKIDWSRFSEQFAARSCPRWLTAIAALPKVTPRPQQDAATKVAVTLGDRLAAVPEANRRRMLLAELQAMAARVLGYPSGTQVDERQPLNEIGLDSLMAVEFRNVLAEALGRPLPVTLLFSYPSISDLESFVSEEVFQLSRAEGADAPVAAKATERVGAVVDAIEELSDEEVDRLLAQKMGGQL